MKKFLHTISILLAALIVCSFVGCTFTAKEEQLKLATPEVVIGFDGKAVWGEDKYALYYIYVIDGGAEKYTNECAVQLKENQTIKVKVISGNEEYADSDFSEPQTYKKVTTDGGNGDKDGDTTYPKHDHSDVNSDGLCDKCGESVIKELSFYAVNDLHGKFMDTSSQPGVDEFTTYMKELYKDGEREEILLSSGDMWQGTVESSSNKGQLMCEWMNDLGFVSMTLGNHEYDWGADVLTPNSKLASFPFLAINVTYNGKAVNYCQASTIVERDGIRIGIIGAIGDCLSSISNDFTSGLRFATDGSLTALVKVEANRLRKEENCDFIVYSIHDGGDGFSSSGINDVTNSDMRYYDSSLSNGYVDLVFEGHSHQSYILKDEYGVFHLQGGGENRSISCAYVSYNTINGTYVVSPEIISNKIYGSSSIAGDPVVGRLFNKYFPDKNPYTTVLGYNDWGKYSGEILSKIAELYYQKGVEVWGSKYNIVLGGGYLNVRSPYQINSGNVTYADIFSVLPFDNEIVLGKVNGYNLKRIISRDNYTNYVTISSFDIENNTDYYIIVDSYSSTYRANNITEVARLGSGTYARDLLADFISSGGWAH